MLLQGGDDQYSNSMLVLQHAAQFSIAKLTTNEMNVQLHACLLARQRLPSNQPRDQRKCGTSRDFATSIGSKRLEQHTVSELQDLRVKPVIASDGIGFIPLRRAR